MVGAAMLKRSLGVKGRRETAGRQETRFVIFTF